MVKKQILVVANDKTTCQGLVNQLKEVDYEGTIATTSQEAIGSVCAKAVPTRF